MLLRKISGRKTKGKPGGERASFVEDKKYFWRADGVFLDRP
tara:strand:- start:1041 stop:1163 length:123 start_codon:yes stop_codon:yes gene_type:complete